MNKEWDEKLLKRLMKIIIPLCFIIIGIIGYKFIFDKEKSKNNITIFVHGYKGTYNTFGHMLNRFEKRYKWGSKAAIYHVSPLGEIETTKMKTVKHKNPFIQVIFEDNRASFEDYTKWLALVIEQLKDKYPHSTFNIVGHSMGGITAIKYLEDFQNNKGQRAIEKVVTLGSPFDGIYSKRYFEIHKDAAATDLKPHSSALQLLREDSKKIPSNVDILSIGSTGDVIATPKSVESISEIVSNNQLNTIIIDRKDLGHSELHEDEEVDHMIHSFLAVKKK